jgi:hypothetical protein
MTSVPRCASVSSDGELNTLPKLKELFAVLREVRTACLDSAHLYGDCEVLLDQVAVLDQLFTIDNKVAGAV